jgi:hypothetical protein
VDLNIAVFEDLEESESELEENIESGRGDYQGEDATKMYY